VPSRRPRPTRATWALLVAGLAAAGVLVPSAARADDGNPLAPVTDPVQSVVGGVTGQTGGGGGTSGASQPGTQNQTQQDPAGTVVPGAGSTPTLPPLDLSQLNALLTQLGISQKCSTAVEKDLTQTVSDIPATAEQLVQEIVGQLQSGGGDLQAVLQDPQNGQQVLMKLVQEGQATVPELTSTSPDELALVQDLQQLLTDLLTTCQPAPPTTAPASPASQAPAAPAAPVAAQPVSYPGYAPTGGTGPADDGPAPAVLAGMGAVLLLAGGAGTVRYRVRSREARQKG